MYDWEKHRASIMEQYVTKNKSLDNVRHYMKEFHGFEASHRAYHMKFKEWNLQKRNRLSRSARSASHKPNDYSGPVVKALTPVCEAFDVNFTYQRQSEEIFDNINVAIPDPPTPTRLHTVVVSNTTSSIPQVDIIRHKLHSAVVTGHVADARNLLESEAGVDFIERDTLTDHNNSRNNLLYIASGLPSAEMVKLLLNHGAGVSSPAVKGERPFQYALRLGLTENIRVFLEHSTMERDNMQAALKAAVCDLQAPNMVQILLDYFTREHPLYDEGCDSVDYTVSVFVQDLTKSALRCRCNRWPQGRHEMAEILNILISHETWISPELHQPVDNLFQELLTPLITDPTWYKFITNAEMSCIAFFLSKLSCQSSNSPFKLTAFVDVSLNHYMLFHTPGSGLSDLLVAHANLDNGNGTGILHQILDPCSHHQEAATGTTSSEMIEVLLQRGVDPDRRDDNGYTALTKLLEGPKNVDVARYLEVLLTEADPALLDDRRQAPLRLAIQNFDEPIRSELVELLLSARSIGFVSPVPYLEPPMPYLEACQYFPITSQWSDYLSIEFKHHMQLFVSADYLAHVVRAAVSISTRKALEENTSKDSKSDFPTRLETIRGAVLARKKYCLPDFPFPDSFVLELVQSQLSSPWSTSSLFPSGQVCSGHASPQLFHQFPAPRKPMYEWIPSIPPSERR